MLSKFQGPSLNHNPNEQKQSPVPQSHAEAKVTPTCGFGAKGVVSRYIHSKFGGQNVTYGGYMHAVADRLPEVSGQDKWIGRTGRRCCHFIPRVVDLVAKGVHDAAGTLLSILSTFILSTGLF